MTANTWQTPLDLSYEVDLWGRVRRSFESARADAQASLADFDNVLLTLQADVAENYFRLRALDAEIATVSGTIDLRNEQVQLVRSRFNGGIGNDLDIARAETELGHDRGRSRRRWRSNGRNWKMPSPFWIGANPFDLPFARHHGTELEPATAGNSRRAAGRFAGTPAGCGRERSAQLAVGQRTHRRGQGVVFSGIHADRLGRLFERRR